MSEDVREVSESIFMQELPPGICIDLDALDSRNYYGVVGGS
jgi:hypothetical protein